MKNKLSALDLLDQDKIWVTREGEQMQLEDMEPSHRRRTLAFLARRMHGLHEHLVRFYLTVPGPTAEIASHMFEREFSEFMNKPVETWFAEQPLVRRLTELVNADAQRERSAALKLVGSHTVTPPVNARRLFSGGIRRG